MKNKHYFNYKKEVKDLNDFYEYFVKLTKNHVFIGAINEWVVDNFYLVIETENKLRNDLRNDKAVKKIVRKDYYFLYEIVKNIYENHDYYVSYEILYRELNKYQKKNEHYFTYEELRAIPIFMAFIINTKLTSVVRHNKKKLEEKLKFREEINLIEKKRLEDPHFNLSDYIKIDEKRLSDNNYLEEFNNSFRSLGEVSNELFIELDKLLDKYNINLKNILKKEYEESIEDNMLIANLFASYKVVTAFQNDRLINKTSFLEKLLLTDKIYQKMTPETKGMYRRKIISHVKHHKLDPYKYVSHLIDESQKKDKHIGFFLFKKTNYNLRAFLFLSLLFLLTIITSYFLSNYLFTSRILSFILILVPLSEIYYQLMQKIWMKFYHSEPMPKLDYSKGIPKTAKTIVTITTIIKNTNKIDEVFANLEKYYIGNRTNNLYFCLLGDTSSSSTPYYKYDQEIAEYGLHKCIELNKKYGEDIFYFVYRKRVFNVSEQEYLGYERKRGALLHFSQILLDKFKQEDYEKYIYAHNLDSLKNKIKYVIALDVDTGFVLNGAMKLVGLMDHPLNEPIFDKNRKRIISGYGIVAPRLSLDIEATNASIYSQAMAGVGGFDVYSSIVPNFYYDVFKEGSFAGKGIFNLEVFEEIFRNSFPENLILSHDLLEGNYLRCGYASDIELIDDFPHSFLVDAKRQHRWARGDAQITPWLFRKVPNLHLRKVKNPLSLIHKWKIFDNIRRAFLYPSLLMIILLGLFISKTSIFLSLGIYLGVVLLPIIFYLREFLKLNNKKFLAFKYYEDLLHGNLAICTRVIISVLVIPYYSFLYMSAFIKAKWRMYISHRNLLNWVTAEEQAKITGDSLKSFIIAFRYNYLLLLILMITTYFFPDNLYPVLICSLFLIMAPFFMYFISKKKTSDKDKLNIEQKEDIKDIAFRTWKYFADFLNEDNNYLIPDNYQLNREEKLDHRTSPTDIGMSILALISAQSLDFIEVKDVLFYLDKIVSSLEKLEKWHGHLYNWYDTVTLEKKVPYFVSSVDSANLVASLIVAAEFTKEYSDSLTERISYLIQSSKFNEFYTGQDVFSIGYDTSEEKLSPYQYNKFASESRILSYTAIAKGDVSPKHWLMLDKTLTKHKKHKGLLSWSGTSFEYYMPLIFMRSYKNTLLDESYDFAFFCQKDYMNEIDASMPWGISESAYAELDSGKNYKYQAFSTPYLKAIETKKQRVILSPYASILAVTLKPKEVYYNLLKFKSLDMYDDYGFFESYDYDLNERVYAYYAHHQGMILASLANYLKDGVIQKLYNKNLNMQAFNLLLKEKVQLNPVVDMKMFGYKKYNYEREKVENDIREFNYLSDIPELSVISNNRYSVLINDRGNGFSKYRVIELNRYRKVTEMDYGIFLYIKDQKTGHIWSNTYAPTNVKPNKYNVVFATDRINFYRTDHGISTKTEIIVTKDNSSEIRKVTFTNNTSDTKTLELTTYTEVTIGKNEEDISHRTFKNLFVSTEYDDSLNSLIACRKNNSKNDRTYYIHRLFVPGEASSYEYESERLNFIGRGNTPEHPNALKTHLTKTVGDNVDPILSLRTTITIPSEAKETVYLIYGSAKSRERALAIINENDTEAKIENQFQKATLSSNINTKLLNMTGTEIRTFNKMLNYLFYTSKYFINDERKDILIKNSKKEDTLWKFGLDGTLPIIYMEISNTEKINLVLEMLKVYEYFKTRGIYLDIIILNKELPEYQGIINQAIEQELYRMNTLFDIYRTPGRVHVYSNSEVTEDEELLLKMVARLRFYTNQDKSIKEMVDELMSTNKKVDFKEEQEDINEKIKYNSSNLKFYNDYGGFNKEGEYVITNQHTPTPWVNVLANKNFGTIISNNGCGFTYAYNSQMYKLTSWTNDIVVDDQSEGFMLDDKKLIPSLAKHGFGYTTLNYLTKTMSLSVTQFVPINDNIKIYDCTLKNIIKKEETYDLSFWINPVLGDNEEKNSRYLLSEYDKESDSLFIRNVFSNNFSNISLFLASSLKLSSYSLEKVLSKTLNTKIKVSPGKEVRFTFVLGCTNDPLEGKKTIKYYREQKNVDFEFKKLKEEWDKTFNIVQIKTNVPEIDLLYPHLIYQTISSRLNARAGFYQVGGAYGFRDQLQDAINLVTIRPDITKEIILNNAQHEFKEGDVLHWWHSYNRLGLRSRYKDDFLWLIYGVHEYILRTGDRKILDTLIPYVEGEPLKEDEIDRAFIYNFSSEKESLFKHLEKIADNTTKSLGENNLPLMGGGDWNDGMNKVGIKGKGTSVWLGFFTVMVLNYFITLSKMKDPNKSVSKYEKTISKIKKALNSEAFENGYYLRAFFDNGVKMGSFDSPECKIDLISQAFSILSDVAPLDKRDEIIRHVEKELVDHNNKIIKLLTPPFNKSRNNPGYIMDYAEGIRENGGQYTHGSIWYIKALLKMKKYEEAFAYFNYLNPIERSLNKKSINTYKVEPYVIAADIYANKNHLGRGGWTWYTGSAGWFYRLLLVDILGFEKEKDILYIRPRVPKSIKQYEFIYNYSSKTSYFIKVKIGNNNQIVVDKEKVKAIKLNDDGKKHIVEVEVKRENRTNS